MGIAQQVKELGEKRTELEKLQESWRQEQAELEMKNATLLQQIDEIKTNIDALTSTIKEIAIGKFKETGDKVFDGGVKIRIMKKLEYLEENAFGWAMQHKIALKLDKKDFEKIAKIQDIDFVKIIEEPSATIPIKIKAD